MIVVDTNVIAHLMLPSEHTDLIEQIFAADSDWAAPVLWRSEMRSVLALYLRKSLVSLGAAGDLLDEAESLMRGREYEVAGRDVLALVDRSSCSAYDCEFVALARGLGVRMVSMDRRVLGAFPDIACAPDVFLADKD